MPECTSLPDGLQLTSSASTARYLSALIEHFCLREDLSTYDPYDIWNTSLGFRTKKFFNRHRRFGVLPAAALTIFDLLNNRPRLFYRKVEYPIVRAFAALSLVNLNRACPREDLIIAARGHLRWLLANSSQGYAGLCWGLGVPNAIAPTLVYDSNTPFATITPYILEALLAYSEERDDFDIGSLVQRVFRFFDEDLQPMEEDSQTLATSYGPFRDRRVINAVSYTMYSLAVCLPYISRTKRLETSLKIAKLYAYLRRHQRSDGSWLYSPDPGSFIDCFHSCIVLKNIIKTSRVFELPRANDVVSTGYEYVCRAFLDRGAFLFKRFSLPNKPGLIRFDLYDNAEALNVAFLLNDGALVSSVINPVLQRFCDGLDVYSQVSTLGNRLNKNTSRWAVMPFLYAASELLASFGQSRTAPSGLQPVRSAG